MHQEVRVVTIRWQPEFTVFDGELDAHHRQLIRYIQVLDDPENRRRADPEFLKMIVEGLVSYTVFHFEAEERMMRDAGFPGREAHRLEHQDFEKDALLFKDCFGRGSQRFERIVLSYLKDWLRSHILTADREFGVWLTVERQRGSTG
jgi:hemerythrin-like metal-binding protein